jgi:predicted ATP-grasp superfamily ATP-dependent carboligase
MRLLICEYVTGGGFLGMDLPASLTREGDMMLRALVKDVAALSGIDIMLVRDRRLGSIGLAADCRMLDANEDPWAAWQQEIDDVDAVWPIAPETGGALSRLSGLVVAAGRTLVGSRPPAVALTASKLATVEHLKASGIAAVPTVSARAAARNGLPRSPQGWVVKPDDGAGAESTRLFRREDDLRGWLSVSEDVDDFIVQPYLPGVVASLSVLCRDGGARLLTCNRQEITVEGGSFRFRGCVVGGLESRRATFERVATAVAAAIPDLWGYVGIDFVDTEEAPVVLEINPRLTTSYVGLKNAIGINPAGLVLGLLDRAFPAVERTRSVTPQRVDVTPHHAP